LIYQGANLSNEKFAIPGVGGIVIKIENEIEYILIQERYKADAPLENGMIEIPAGKIREFESIYDCLRREIKEETGYTVNRIEGEDKAEIIELNGYKVINYTPFSSSQNIYGTYPIMVQVFKCYVNEASNCIDESDESKNIRWSSIEELKMLLESTRNFFPMHISTLKKYIATKIK